MAMRLLGAFWPNTLDGTIAGAAKAAVPVLSILRRVRKLDFDISPPPHKSRYLSVPVRW
jgi:hypothetical protein